MRCKHCREKFETKVFLQKFCMIHDECISAFVEFAKQVNVKKVKKENALEKSILKEKLKTLSEWKKDLQTEINTLVREIDKGHPCIATGSYDGKKNAGHYISVGSNQTLRFHLENIFLQSEHSNSWKAGDTIRYQQGIINTFGQEYMDYMNLLQSITPIKLAIEDIKPKIPLVRSLIKWVKLQDKKFSNEERIFLRKQFNEKINIY